jgi:hypothetical protein
MSRDDMHSNDATLTCADVAFHLKTHTKPNRVGHKASAQRLTTKGQGPELRRDWSFKNGLQFTDGKKITFRPILYDVLLSPSGHHEMEPGDHPS